MSRPRRLGAQLLRAGLAEATPRRAGNGEQRKEFLRCFVREIQIDPDAGRGDHPLRAAGRFFNDGAGGGSRTHMARRPGDFKATGERQRTRDLGNSLPFPVSEESEEGRRVRGVWTPRWTPVPSVGHPLDERDHPAGGGRRRDPVRVKSNDARLALLMAPTFAEEPTDHLSWAPRARRVPRSTLRPNRLIWLTWPVHQEG
jgi:hypothetical protein